MSFQNYLRIPRVVDLTSTEKVEAIRELVRELCKALRISRRQKYFVDEILKREEAASTFIGQGIAIPHLRADIKGDFAIAVGRSAAGIKYDAARGALAYILVLVITNEKADSSEHLQVMSEVASFFKNDLVREKIRTDPTTVDFGELEAAQGGAPADDRAAKGAKKGPQPVLNAAVELAKDIKATALMVFADTVRDNDFLDTLKNRGKVIVVTSNKSRFDPDDKRIAACIQAPSFPASRTGQVKIGILLALSRNLIDNSDKVVCISGNSKAGVFDTIVALDVSSEYEFFFTNSPALLPPDIMPEVLERVLGLAGEIAVEGREGKPLGTIFVLGDTNTVNKYVTQLIINPFRGYSEAERNIIDPALAETVKEFASIDGAFVITGDGIVLSAGSYLRPQAEVELLPSGFGSRHAAAAGITACTKALSITVSESTGMVTLFKNGAIVLTISKPVEREKSSVHTYL
ncbi:MAG TPA: diadenylate cyclase [Chitinivibrionales bacterium]|jgi:DNA integrity scanning protein DisA with diadenylate cyclase activity/mannitol/fructose-specific phosphotransferase system IIA component (Ntr-type)|nr:diadenylate cyclase [Chitinivibrionales bacterium]